MGLVDGYGQASLRDGRLKSVSDKGLKAVPPVRALVAFKMPALGLVEPQAVDVAPWVDAHDGSGVASADADAAGLDELPFGVKSLSAGEDFLCPLLLLAAVLLFLFCIH